ncbi:MAG: homocysteine S-methyltransferase family protein [Acidobacteriota bacterium]|jgi:5-methyltetrahydrofolate--homocysteine methyltransferase|nr:homocysteine S-methyltransferase family protein [Acidobacteriota bacterium]
MENILKRLQRGDIIVGDGALGTMLMQRGLKHGEPPELFNVEKPQVIEEIAGLYLDAGAEIIETNTFGASPPRLRQFSLENRMDELNRAAVEAVRRAVGDKAYIAGSVGPSGKNLEPMGDAEPEQLFDGFAAQIHALAAAGADIICIETMMDANEAVLAVKAARSVNAGIPVIATMTFNKTPRGFFTLMENSVKDAAAMLKDAGADIVGSNCGDGMENMIGIAREFRQCTELPVIIQGNAGLPKNGENGLVYLDTPEYVAGKAAELLKLGVQIIGGCCGTTPEHIRAIRSVVDGF